MGLLFCSLVSPIDHELVKALHGDCHVLLCRYKFLNVFILFDIACLAGDIDIGTLRLNANLHELMIFPS